MSTTDVASDAMCQQPSKKRGRSSTKNTADAIVVENDHKPSVSNVMNMETHDVNNTEAISTSKVVAQKKKKKMTGQKIVHRGAANTSSNVGLSEKFWMDIAFRGLDTAMSNVQHDKGVFLTSDHWTGLCAAIQQYQLNKQSVTMIQ